MMNCIIIRSTIKSKILILLFLIVFVKAISSEYTIPRSARNVYAEDLDLDGDNDIVVRHMNGVGETSMSILRNDGYGNLTIIDTSYIFNGSYANIYSVNLDSNDFPEIVTTYVDFSSGDAERYIRIFHNTYGIFETVSDYPLIYDEPVYLLECGDIDNDNDIDIVAACNLGQRWGWLSNEGNNIFTEPIYTDVEYTPGGLACSDMNNDDRDDVILCGLKLELYLSYFDYFEYVLVEEAVNYANDVEIADIDNNGYNDIIVSNYGSPTSPHFLNIYYNDGNENFSNDYSEEIDIGISNMTMADLNNDSYEDIIYAKYENYIYIRLNENGIFGDEQSFVTNVNAPHFSIPSCYSSDIDGNGWNDIITVQNSNISLEGNLHILFNDGEGGFIEEPLLSNDTLYSESNKLFNYPNPFNSYTVITFELQGNLENNIIEIFNIKGQKIREYSLSSNQNSIIWDGTNHANFNVSSGIYLYRLKTDEAIIATKKMLMLKRKGGN